MELIFTHHSIKRIEERKISLKDVYDCILNPLRIEKQQSQVIFLKLIDENQHLLILPCRIENGKCTIITAYKSSQINRYLDL